MSILDFSAKGLLDKHIVPWKDELSQSIVREKAENKFKKFASLFCERLFVNLVCYADESGTHDVTGRHEGSEAVAVAGFLSWSNNWKRFCGQWAEVLSRFEVPFFHYADLVLGKWPYRGWSRDKIDNLICELIPIARDNTLLGVAGLVSVKDYYIIPDYKKGNFKKPYHFCFQFFLGCVLDQLRKGCKCGCEKPFAPGERVAFFFDQTEEFGPEAHKIFLENKKANDIEKRFGTIAFADKVDCVPLQAADLLAGRCRKVLTRILEGKTAINKDSWDDVLGSRGNIHFAYFDGPALNDFFSSISPSSV